MEELRAEPAPQSQSPCKAEAKPPANPGQAGKQGKGSSPRLQPRGISQLPRGSLPRLALGGRLGVSGTPRNVQDRVSSLPLLRPGLKTPRAKGSAVPAKTSWRRKSRLQGARPSFRAQPGGQAAQGARRMQLLESSGHWERGEPGLQRPRTRCLPPSLEGLLGRGGLTPFLPKHVQLSRDPQFPGCKQGRVPGAPCASWLRGGRLRDLAALSKGSS